MINRYIIFLKFLFIGLNVISQNNNYFLLECSPVFFNPIKKEFHSTHSKEFADDYAYDLVTTPKRSGGIRLSCGYEFLLKRKNNIEFRLPLLLSYKFISLNNSQFGEYYGGAANEYFYGNRNSTAFFNIIAFSAGLNLTILNSTNSNIWDVGAVFCSNLNTITKNKIIETPYNCNKCISKNQNYKYKDFTFFPAIEFKIAKLFSKKSMLFGPFISYSYNIIKNVDGYNSSTTNLQYYNSFDIGIKLKL